MSVPGFQDLTLPVLSELSDGQEHLARDVRDRVAGRLNLSQSDLDETLPSGKQTRYANRVAWAHVYLKQAGLLDSPRRGVYRITDRGTRVLANPPVRIDIAFLMQYPEMVAFRSKRGSDETASDRSEDVERPADIMTPDEQLRVGYQQLKDSLAVQLLSRLQQVSPRFFEEMVVELLVKMGYGGSHEDAARVVGRGGDEGIDGIIKEDRLGLESIYVQAKRWQSSVGRPIIQQFAGALQGQRARKGVLITTSAFTRDAVDYARGLQNTIVLIDGTELAQLMIDFGIGVSEVENFSVRRLDEDYFTDE